MEITEADFKSFSDKLLAIKDNHLAKNEEEKVATPEFNADLVRFIYRKRILSSNFRDYDLKRLDAMWYLESYLVPYLRKDTITHDFFFSAIAIINQKFAEHIIFWDFYPGSSAELEEKYQIFFEYLLTIDFTDKNLSHSEVTQIILFLDQSFKHLEKNFYSSTCLKLIDSRLLVTIPKRYLKALFLKFPKLIPLYEKQLGNAELSRSAEATYLSRLSGYFWAVLEEGVSENKSEGEGMVVENGQKAEQPHVCQEKIKFCFTFLTLVVDLLSQVPTRKFVKLFVQSHHFVARLRVSKLLQLVRPLGSIVQQIDHLLHYPINDQTGQIYSVALQQTLRSDTLNAIKTYLFQKFTLLTSQKELDDLSFLQLLESPMESLLALMKHMNIDEPEEPKKAFLADRKSYFDLLMEIFKGSVPRKPEVNYKNIALLPTETEIWDFEKIPNDLEQAEYKIVFMPKINLQFLSVEDYLLRNFQLFKLESNYEIRHDLEDSINRVNPIFNFHGEFESFKGWARMAIPIRGFLMHEVAPPKLGREEPSRVMAEITYSVASLQQYLKKEWEKLKEHDVLFMVSFSKNSTAGKEKGQKESFMNKYAIKAIRGCEVLSQFDEARKEISQEYDGEKIIPDGNLRYLTVLLDPYQYKMDLENVEIAQKDIYSTFHLLIRRRPHENTFKAILSTILSLMDEEPQLPDFLSELILGYGNVEESTSKYNMFRMNKELKFSYYDTFIDSEHFRNCFLDNELIPKELRETKQYEQMTYFTKNYKRNDIRFTNRQVEAISSAMYPGLSLIVGPPGTGKTDVTVQILSLLYHNFREERVLVITHSNHALNDIFEKIARLDIDERHLVRLGMGEKDLNLQKDFSKYGRVNYMLERRFLLLAEVSKLAESFKQASGEEEQFTCETADIFYRYQVVSRWEEFVKFLRPEGGRRSVDSLVQNFPFKKYVLSSLLFSSLNDELRNENLFNPENPFESEWEKCSFYWREICKLFQELREIRAFEILRNNRERGNYLLTQQSKIIAMTCTHAALTRHTMIKIGLEYDTVVFEEAGQILEIESFIPMVLQRSKFSNQPSRLKRIIMLGDENQLPPIIKNTIIQKVANMEQSLFTRLIRLNCPHHLLCDQGRARTSILNLYSWKYPYLKSLPSVLPDPSLPSNPYNFANPGFLFDYQFINVGPFNGKGESTPTPFFYQNLAEAEYVVAVYMYLCLIGYDPAKISILTTYNGQKYLLRDIVNQKCCWGDLFKKPAKITTVDKYQGQQNDIILLSLVRTENIGHIRDPRRLVVAMSRARLGLYVFGRFNLYESFAEMKNTFKLFRERSLKLELCLGERYSDKRVQGESRNVKTVENFQEMYKVIESLLKK